MPLELAQGIWKASKVQLSFLSSCLFQLLAKDPFTSLSSTNQRENAVYSHSQLQLFQIKLPQELNYLSQYCGTLQSRGFKQDSLKIGIVPSSAQKESTCKVAIVLPTESVVLLGFIKLVGGKNILATK